jgi:hypothetical protein
VDRHKGFITDKTGYIIPRISVLILEIIDFAIELGEDFFTLELTINSDC